LASWYVGWIDPEGKRRSKSCAPGEDGQRNAEKLRRKTEPKLANDVLAGNRYQAACNAVLAAAR
jgi:hypothetical protein